MERSFFLKLAVSAAAIVIASSDELFGMREATDEFLRHPARIIYILDEWHPPKTI